MRQRGARTNQRSLPRGYGGESGRLSARFRSALRAGHGRLLPLLVGFFLLLPLSGCYVHGNFQVWRMWPAWRTYLGPALVVEEIDHMPYDGVRVSQLNWQYGRSPGRVLIPSVPQPASVVYSTQSPSASSPPTDTESGKAGRTPPVPEDVPQPMPALGESGSRPVPLPRDIQPGGSPMPPKEGTTPPSAPPRPAPTVPDALNGPTAVTPGTVSPSVHWSRSGRVPDAGPQMAWQPGVAGLFAPSTVGASNVVPGAGKPRAQEKPAERPSGAWLFGRP